MKKMTLLFTIVCAGQLYGMEAEQGLGNLPKDIHYEIVKQAIESSSTLQDAVKAVEVACALQGACYDNLKEFTKLVHILANKFSRSGTIGIAGQFTTSTAEKYKTLSNGLSRFIIQSNLEKASDFLSQGADPNTISSSGKTLLDIVMESVNNLTILKKEPFITLLLSHGAIPTEDIIGKLKGYLNMTSSQSVHDKLSKMVDLAEKAMQK